MWTCSAHAASCRCQSCCPKVIYLSCARLQVLLDENRHITLTDTPPEEERIEEPEEGTPTQASKHPNIHTALHLWARLILTAVGKSNVCCRCGATWAPSWSAWMTSGMAASRWERHACRWASVWTNVLFVPQCKVLNASCLKVLGLDAKW